MKHRIFTILFIFSFTLNVFPQENAYSSFDASLKNSVKFNRFLLNPAFTFAKEESPTLTVVNRRQWVKFENGPQLYFANYLGSLNYNSRFGVGVYQQTVGLLKNFGGVLNYSYNVPIGLESNLTFGVNTYVYNSTFDFGKIITVESEPLLLNQEPNTLIAIKPGINFGTEMFDFGISINNLVLYNLSTSEMVNDNQENSYYGYLMYTGYVNSYRGFFEDAKFSSLFSVEKNKDETAIAGNFLFEIPKKAWVNGGYNTLYGFSAGIGLTLSEKFSFGYTYDLGLADVSQLGASHEFLISYRFEDYDENNRYYQSVYNKSKKKTPSTPKKSKEQIAQDKADKADALAKAQRDKLAAEEAARKQAADKAKADAEAKAQRDKLAAEEAARKQAADKVKADAEAKAQRDKLAAEEAARKQAADKAKADALAKAQRDKLAAEEAARKQAADKAKVEAEAKAQRDKLAAEEAARKQAADKAKADAEAKAQRDRLAEEAARKQAADKAKADAEAKAQRDRLAEEAARKQAADKAKAEAEAKAQRDKLAAEEAARKQAADKAKAEAEAKAQRDKLAAEEEARKLAADKAKAEAEAKAQRDKLAAEEAARKQAADKAKAEAEAKAQRDKLAAEEEARKLAADKAKAEAEAKAQRDKLAAEEAARKQAADKAKAEGEISSKLLNDESNKAIETVRKDIDVKTKASDKLIQSLDSIVKARDLDLKEYLLENTLNSDGTERAPRKFVSTSEQNAQLQNLKSKISNNKFEFDKLIKDFETTNNQRIKELKLKGISDEEAKPLNDNYLKILNDLKQKRAKFNQLEIEADLKIQKIKEEKEAERLRRIKKAEFDSERERNLKEQQLLENLKKNQNTGSPVVNNNDKITGTDALSNAVIDIPIIKKLTDVSSGYYLVLATFSNIKETEDYLKMVVNSGGSNVNFFYNLHNSTYYVYIEKQESMGAANQAIKAKGTKSYNKNMFIVKVE